MSPRDSSHLTPEEVVALRERAFAGATNPELARFFNVSPGYVGMIARGERRPRAGGPIREPRHKGNPGKRK
jgi:hypothetical protein